MKYFMGLLLLIFAVPSLASGYEKTAYHGEIIYDHVEYEAKSEPVYLELSHSKPFQEQVRWFTKEFRIGDLQIHTSGLEDSQGTIVFNTNDDYIPGGNATFNIDVTLDLGSSLTGQFSHYVFPNGDGDGGSNKGGKLLRSGTIYLSKIID
jgi:hypothetical protein